MNKSSIANQNIQKPLIKRVCLLINGQSLMLCFYIYPISTPIQMLSMISTQPYMNFLTFRYVSSNTKTHIKPSRQDGCNPSNLVISRLMLSTLMSHTPHAWLYYFRLSIIAQSYVTIYLVLIL